MTLEDYLDEEIKSSLEKKENRSKEKDLYWDIEKKRVLELLQIYIPFFFDTLLSGMTDYKKVMTPSDYTFKAAIVLEDKYLITADKDHIYLSHLVNPLLVDWIKIKNYPSRKEWTLTLLDLQNEYLKSLV
jgi:hypothetical protein